MILKVSRHAQTLFLETCIKHRFKIIADLYLFMLRSLYFQVHFYGTPFDLKSIPLSINETHKKQILFWQSLRRLKFITRFFQSIFLKLSYSTDTSIVTFLIDLVWNVALVWNVSLFWNADEKLRQNRKQGKKNQETLLNFNLEID